MCTARRTALILVPACARPTAPRRGACRLGGDEFDSRREHTRSIIGLHRVQDGGLITNATSSRPWPGEAAVNVSMVNWIKGLVDAWTVHARRRQNVVCQLARASLHTSNSTLDLRETSAINKSANSSVSSLRGASHGNQGIAQTDGANEPKVLADRPARTRVRFAHMSCRR